MTKTMRVLMTAALACCIGAGAAWADTNPLNNADSLTITITPSLDYGVDLDTAGVKMEGSANLSVTAGLDTPIYMSDGATMNVLGNFQNQEVQVSAAGLDTWQVDTDETASEDAVQVYALFTDTSRASRPADGDFLQSARHQVTGALQFAGEPNGAEDNADTANKYERITQTNGGGVDMDGMHVGYLRKLWLRLDTPSATTTADPQNIQVTLTADTGIGH